MEIEKEIVREVRLVREREREIQREKDGSDVTIFVLNLAKVAKNVALFETVPILRKICTVK